VKNGEKPLSYFKGKELAHVSAYMAYTSRGNKFNVQIPNTSEALNAYEKERSYILLKKVNSISPVQIVMFIKQVLN